MGADTTLGPAVFNDARDIKLMVAIRARYIGAFNNQKNIEISHQAVPALLDINVQEKTPAFFLFSTYEVGHLPKRLTAAQLEMSHFNDDAEPYVSSTNYSLTHDFIAIGMEYISSIERHILQRRTRYTFDNIHRPDYYLIYVVSDRAKTLCKTAVTEALISEYQCLQYFLDALTEIANEYFTPLPLQQSEPFHIYLETAGGLLKTMQARIHFEMDRRAISNWLSMITASLESYHSQLVIYLAYCFTQPELSDTLCVKQLTTGRSLEPAFMQSVIYQKLNSILTLKKPITQHDAAFTLEAPGLSKLLMAFHQRNPTAVNTAMIAYQHLLQALSMIFPLMTNMNALVDSAQLQGEYEMVHDKTLSLMLTINLDLVMAFMKGCRENMIHINQCNTDALVGYEKFQGPAKNGKQASRKIQTLNTIEGQIEQHQQHIHQKIKKIERENSKTLSVQRNELFLKTEQLLTTIKEGVIIEESGGLLQALQRHCPRATDLAAARIAPAGVIATKAGETTSRIASEMSMGSPHSHNPIKTIETALLGTTLPAPEPQPALFQNLFSDIYQRFDSLPNFDFEIVRSSDKKQPRRALPPSVEFMHRLYLHHGVTQQPKLFRLKRHQVESINMAEVDGLAPLLTQHPLGHENAFKEKLIAYEKKIRQDAKTGFKIVMHQLYDAIDRVLPQFLSQLQSIHQLCQTLDTAIQTLKSNASHSASDTKKIDQLFEQLKALVSTVAYVRHREPGTYFCFSRDELILKGYNAEKTKRLRIISGMLEPIYEAALSEHERITPALDAMFSVQQHIELKETHIFDRIMQLFADINQNRFASEINVIDDYHQAIHNAKNNSSPVNPIEKGALMPPAAPIPVAATPIPVATPTPVALPRIPQSPRLQPSDSISTSFSSERVAANETTHAAPLTSVMDDDHQAIHNARDNAFRENPIEKGALMPPTAPIPVAATPIPAVTATPLARPSILQSPRLQPSNNISTAFPSERVAADETTHPVAPLIMDLIPAPEINTPRPVVDGLEGLETICTALKFSATSEETKITDLKNNLSNLYQHLCKTHYSVHYFGGESLKLANGTEKKVPRHIKKMLACYEANITGKGTEPTIEDIQNCIHALRNIAQEAKTNFISWKCCGYCFFQPRDNSTQQYYEAIAGISQ